MKDSFSVLKGGALRRVSQAQKRREELLKMWEIDTEEYAVATGVPLEDVRDRVMPFEGWLVEQGFAIQAQLREHVFTGPPPEPEWSRLEREHETWLRGQGKDPASMSIRERVEMSRKWLAEIKGFSPAEVEERLSFWWGPALHPASKKAQFLTDMKTNVDDQVTDMIGLALGYVKMTEGAWQTYLNMKKPGALPEVLSAQVDMVRRDVNDTIGTLQSILSRLLLY